MIKRKIMIQFLASIFENEIFYQCCPKPFPRVQTKAGKTNRQAFQRGENATKEKKDIFCNLIGYSEMGSCLVLNSQRFDQSVNLIILEVWKMKPMTTKQAEKWLGHVKSSNSGTFKEINKILKKYERTNDEHECFVRLNSILLDHPDLTNEINNFLDEGHRFVINRSQVERINDLVKYIKKVDPRAFNEIVVMITSLSSRRSTTDNNQSNEEDQNNQLINFVLEKVRDNSQLFAYANKALYFSPQQLIQSLDLSHLRSSKKSEQLKPQQDYEMVLQPIQEREEKIEPEKPIKKIYPPFLSENDEKVYLRQLEANLPPELFYELVKVIEIYQVGIISKDEAIQITHHLPEGDAAAVKDLIQSRESDRRRNSMFRPLSDMDFSNAERASHSYVKMPEIYPHYCSKDNAISCEVLNKEWISVPRGSEDTFNIRIKNTYEDNLIRAEDDRYQFDIYQKRLLKSIQILESIEEDLQLNSEANIDKKIKALISLGITQIMYKNFSKEQKEEFEYHLGKIQPAVLNLLSHRLKAQKAELQDIRQIHGIKTWLEIANKNFSKSLDIKGHEFKRTQKFKMKASVFLEQLKKKVAYLKEGGQKTQHDPFSAKKDFFTVLNSFQISSRKQRCLHRKLPVPEVFQLTKDRNSILFPAIIMAFEDQKALSLTYSFLLFNLENSTAGQAEKTRCKFILKLIMSRFFKLPKFQSHYLSTQFDEQNFFQLISDSENIPADQLKSWIHIETEDEFKQLQESEELPKLKVEQGDPSVYDYLPSKNENNIVFYTSENFYVFLRFLYTVYERVIRLKEIVGDDKKVILFELLYFSCIKSKQSSRYEESLNALLGSESAYIFTTFYKLVENVCKNLNAVSTCMITGFSLRLLESDSEAAYIQLLNHELLENGMTNFKLVRCAFDLPSKLLYINSVEPRYCADEHAKELPKRRSQIAQKIQIYTVMGNELDIPHQGVSHIKNRSQYCFEGNSIKLANLAGNEDILVHKKKKGHHSGNSMKVDLKKLMLTSKKFD